MLSASCLEGNRHFFNFLQSSKLSIMSGVLERKPGLKILLYTVCLTKVHHDAYLVLSRSFDAKRHRAHDAYVAGVIAGGDERFLHRDYVTAVDLLLDELTASHQDYMEARRTSDAFQSVYRVHGSG